MAFANFFYHLRESGIKISINEWITFMDALNQGLAHSSLMGFYYLCRAVLIKSESDFDKFDLAFLTYFGETEEEPAIPEELLAYLSQAVVQQEYDQEEVDARAKLEYEELQELLRQRLQEQRGSHNGGKKWIGTGGTSPLGNNGYSPLGIRIGGTGGAKSARKAAAARGYRDFREDGTLDIRQYQMAFRRLRQMSSVQDSQEKELNLEGTIQKTCQNGGLLRLEYKKPRKNAVKLLLLFDSGGSMDPYRVLCSQLFQAVSKANHFRQLKVYYFHNCPYNRIYRTPVCTYAESLDTQWLIDNLPPDYKVILVGDASMAMWEMRYYTGGREGRPGDQMSGLAWLQKIKQRFSHAIWLNPIAEEEWGAESISYIRKEIPMFHLSVSGIEMGMKALVAAR